MSIELRISFSLSSNPLCPRVRPCVCGGSHESEALLLIPPGGFNLSADGALVDVWSYFPGLKVGQYFSILFIICHICWR